MERVIVTGGAGFLGQHLVALLREKGIPEKHIFAPRSHQYDLRKQEDAERLFQDFPCDTVFHLATVTGGIGMMQQHPATVFHDNLLMNTHTLDAARKAGVKKFVAVGTGLIYPKGAPIPLREDTIWDGLPHEITACYGIPARALLTQCQAYRKEFGFNAIYVIPSNLYGPGDHFFNENPHVIPSLIRKFSEEKEVTLFGKGEATREFLYVEDAARALIFVAERYDSPEPLNVGTGIATPIKEIAREIIALTSFKGTMRWDAAKPEGEKLRFFDSSKMKALGFAPKISLEDGLKETIDWYNANKTHRH